MPALNILKLYEDRFILKSCLQLVLLVCCTLSLASYLTASYLTIFAIVIMTFGCYYVVVINSLPPGDPILVKEILGVDFFDDVNSDLDETQNNQNEFKMKVVAHRFAGLDAPENSLLALETCHKAGCYAVEFDISITADNEIILFHDETLERLAGSNEHISKSKWEQLSTINIAKNHPFRDQFQDAKIAKFEDVVKKCIDYDMRMFIDIKDSKPEVIDGVCKMFEKYPMMYRRAVVSSFNPWIIYQIRSRRSSVVGCLAWRPYYLSCHNFIPENPSSQERRSSSVIMYYLSRVADRVHVWAYFNILPKILGLSCVLVQKDTITRSSIRWWRSMNIRCLAWTVNQPSEKQHFAKNLRIAYLTDTMHAD